jgi:hypothetical protein
MRKRLHKIEPNHEEELHRQPIVWNELVTTRNYKILGAQTRLAWGPFAAGPSHTFAKWSGFIATHACNQQEVISKFRGGRQMGQAVHESFINFSTSSTNISVDLQRWFGEHDTTGNLQFMWIVCEGRNQCLKVMEEGQNGERVDRVVAAGEVYRIRVVATTGKIWNLDSPLSKDEQHTKLWVYEKKPRVRLQRDLGEYV